MRPARLSALLALLSSVYVVMGTLSPLTAEPTPPSSARPQPLNLKGVTGVGVGETLTGVRGVSLYRGVSPLLWAELTLGGSLEQEEGRDTLLTGSAALAFHFTLFQAGRHSALSAGARYVMTSALACLGDEASCEAGAAPVSGAFEQRAELPLRLTHFLNPYLALHAELGLGVLFGSGERPLIGDAPLNGLKITVFQGAHLGVTLWL